MTTDAAPTAPGCPQSCSPPSTTWASPCPTSTRRSPSTPRPSACTRCTRRPTRSRASARRCSPSATASTRIQLLAPLTPESTIAKFIGRSGPGLQQLAFRVDRRRGGERDPARARAAAALRRPQARHGRQPGELRPPQGRRRRPRRAGRAGGDSATEPPGLDRWLPAGNIALTASPPRQRRPGRHRVNEIRDAILSRLSSTPWPGWPCRSPTARVAGPQGRAGHVRGPAHQGEGPAQVAARRGGAHPRARPGRGDRRRHGVVGELQHRLDVDLRAGLHLRLPGALRQALRADQAARPALPRGRLRPGRRRAAGRARA